MDEDRGEGGNYEGRLGSPLIHNIIDMTNYRPIFTCHSAARIGPTSGQFLHQFYVLILIKHVHSTNSRSIKKGISKL